MSLRVEQLAAHHALRLTDLLLGDTPTNALALGWLETHGIVSSEFAFVGAWDDRTLAASALVIGSDVVCLSHGAEPAARALGAHLARHMPDLRTLVGPAETTVPFRSFFPVPDDLVVLRQRSYALRAEQLSGAGTAALRPATLHDENDLVRAGLAMHEGEVGRPLRPGAEAAFARATRAKIVSERAWVARDPYTDRLLFKAGIASASAEVAQLEGVWVDPEFRRQGIAAQCMAALCRRLLTQHRTLALVVEASNQPARALYARLGFRVGGPYETVMYDR